jgi:hypothetical protein
MLHSIGYYLEGIPYKHPKSPSQNVQEGKQHVLWHWEHFEEKKRIAFLSRFRFRWDCIPRSPIPCHAWTLELLRVNYVASSQIRPVVVVIWKQLSRYHPGVRRNLPYVICAIDKHWPESELISVIWLSVWLSSWKGQSVIRQFVWRHLTVTHGQRPYLLIWPQLDSGPYSLAGE